MINADKLNLRVYNNDDCQGLEVDEMEHGIVGNMGYIPMHERRGQHNVVEAVIDLDRMESIYGYMCEMVLERHVRNIERNG